MNNQPILINAIIEQADPFIRKHGDREGYAMYRKSEIQTVPPQDYIQQVAPQYISYIENNDADTPFYARNLLSMYEWSERNGKTPEFLKEWVLGRLLKISQGGNADSVFHLNTRVGAKKTKPLHNQLRCVSFVALKIREGMGKSEAVQACAESFRVTERAIYGFLEGTSIGGHISDNTLIFFRDNDISDDYTPY